MALKLNLKRDLFKNVGALHNNGNLCVCRRDSNSRVVTVRACSVDDYDSPTFCTRERNPPSVDESVIDSAVHAPGLLLLLLLLSLMSILEGCMRRAGCQRRKVVTPPCAWRAFDVVRRSVTSRSQDCESLSVCRPYPRKELISFVIRK